MRDEAAAAMFYFDNYLWLKRSVLTLDFLNLGGLFYANEGSASQLQFVWPKKRDAVEGRALRLVTNRTKVRKGRIP